MNRHSNRNSRKLILLHRNSLLLLFPLPLSPFLLPSPSVLFFLLLPLPLLLFLFLAVVMVTVSFYPAFVIQIGKVSTVRSTVVLLINFSIKRHWKLRKKEIK